jgi:hypothetical protein
MNDSHFSYKPKFLKKNTTTYQAVVTGRVLVANVDTRHRPTYLPDQHWFFPTKIILQEKDFAKDQTIKHQKILE